MFGSVDGRLAQDEAGVGHQDLIMTWRAEVFKADLDAGSAHLGQEPAGRAAVEVYTKRKLFPAEPQRRAQVRDCFDGTSAWGENLIYIRIAFQKLTKARLDKHGGE
jgi:hypothetical protein